MIVTGPVGSTHHLASAASNPRLQRFSSCIPNSAVLPAVRSYREDIAPFARPFAERAVSALVRMLPPPSAAGHSLRVLDHGAGTGQVARMLHLYRPDVQVHCLDPSADLLSDAPPTDPDEQRWATKSCGTAGTADLLAEDGPEAFDATISSLVFSFVGDPHTDLSTLHRHTTTGGRLVITVLGGPNHVTPFTRYWEAIHDAGRHEIAELWRPDRYPHLRFASPDVLVDWAAEAQWRNLEVTPVQATRRISGVNAWRWLNRALPVGLGGGYATLPPELIERARQIFLDRWSNETAWRSGGWMLTAEK